MMVMVMVMVMVMRVFAIMRLRQMYNKIRMITDARQHLQPLPSLYGDKHCNTNADYSATMRLLTNDHHIHQ